MQQNHQRQVSQTLASQSRSVKQFISELVEGYRPKLTQQSITLETDLDAFEACFQPSLLHSAAAALVENAISAMPDGGEISITLIDGKHQWELEVADSLGMAYSSVEHRTTETESDLPIIIPFPETEQLRDAHRAAMAHGGQIQTWSCPQGGTAHVLVIPRKRIQSGLASQTSELNANPSRRETL